MGRYVLRRLALSVPVLIAASIVVFVGLTIVGDPLGELRITPGVDQATIQRIVERRFLDQPLYIQYLEWVRTIFTEGFGTTVGGNPIWPMLRRSMWFTLQLIVAAEILALVFGILIGVGAARRQYSFFDYTATTISFLGYSVPVFWFALILQVLATNLFAATGIRFFYTAGVSSIDPGTGFAFLVDRLQHLVLPILTIAFVSVAAYSRYMRASMLEVINSNYITTARAKGLSEGQVMRRHAMRNALIPIATLAALNFGTVFTGAIVAEVVFGLPGMGTFFIRSLTDREVYSIMAFLMVTSVVVIFANMLADLAYGALNPRIRR
jgi:peptide/nickel transport system permease protein